MTTDHATAALLVVRAWRHPGGPLCARVGAVTDPTQDPASWELCVGADRTLVVVGTWLQRWSLELPEPPHR
jgi:hypothetical protein